MKGERGGIAAVKAKSKTMKPADNPTDRELRRRRDLVWLYLASIGMNAVEIERACAMANRSRWQIRRRIEQCRGHQAKGRHARLSA